MLGVHVHHEPSLGFGVAGLDRTRVQVWFYSSRSSSGRILGDLSSIPSIIGLYGGGVKRHSEGHLVFLFSSHSRPV